ncbi:MAG TPA: YceI family protein [Vitreimonas sp.]|uniref:cytochrome b/b6 domain-containing protein n=1 Tax=Vitreimonas sp. TaxID=3069702 RepID=UPI002D22FB50|nr:YceI family protein [Vitreimonas sp.]HYD89052.1 YceI family protein [Vitreimonas sp.]
MTAPAQRYAAIAIVLHWAIAFAIALMIPLGWWMSDQAEDGVVSDALFQTYQLHKSIGLTVLALSLAQVAWRIANPPPALPAHMPVWERFVAHATHWALYGLMVALPLTGWLYVSAGWSEHDDAPLLVTTRWFGLFVVPHLFGLPNAGADVREEVADFAMEAHELMAWGAIVLAGLHAAAALKHHVLDRDNVLTLMVPGLRPLSGGEAAPKNPARLAVLGGGLALTFAGVAAALFTLSSLGAGPQAQSEIEITETAPAAVEAPLAEAAPAPATPQIGAPAPWRVDPRASSIGFGFDYDDGESAARFAGRFTRWRADIRFDPNNLDASRVVVTIETASATDGVALHDRALPGPEWFDAAAHPTAVFRAGDFRRLGGDAYEARGELTIRGRSRSFTLPFTLAIDGDRAVMTSITQLDRRDFDIGKDTDADEMISREIDLSLHVEALRQP